MKTNCVRLNQTSLRVLLLAVFIPAATAQTISQVISHRYVYNDFISETFFQGRYESSYPGTNTYAFGPLVISEAEATPSNQDHGYVNASDSVFQDTTITTTTTSLHATGMVQVAGSGTAAAQLGGNSGSASWLIESEMDISFQVDQPFNYRLTATTSHVNPPGDTSSKCYVTLGNNNDTPYGYGAYGAPFSLNNYDYTPLADAGTNNGTLPLGTYNFHAFVQANYGVNPTTTPVSENFPASFTLDVTPVPQPPVVLALTSNGPGAFHLIWDALQDGNYRVLSSSNLVDWTEYIPSGSYSSGLNTNSISATPGAGKGFFRVQYLP